MRELECELKQELKRIYDERGNLDIFTPATNDRCNMLVTMIALIKSDKDKILDQMARDEIEARLSK